MDSADFWTARTKALVDEGFDPPLAYLNLLLAEIGHGKPLGALSNQQLRDFGSSLDATWFTGLPALFDDLRDIVSTHRDIAIEFNIISGGLQAVIEGSEHVAKHFTAVYGCQLAEGEDGVIRYIKRCVTFTEKTRFLFEINKGIPASKAATKPHLVNENVPEDLRRIPFRNMIYVGDGLTDIPCFSVVEKGGGHAFGVFQPGKESAKQAFQQLMESKRVRGLYAPEYGENDALGAILRLAVSNICTDINLRSAQAY